MAEEMNSLQKNRTCELVRKPKNTKVMGCKWIYKKKTGIPTVEPERFKACLVAKGYSQREGIDYQEIFFPVVRHTSIRMLLAITTTGDYELEQMDVKMPFLHGNIDEKIPMEQPEGFKTKGKEDHVCLLKKSLYDLKQTPRQWYKCFDSLMVENKFSRSQYDSCVYYQQLKNGNYIYLLLYVDDMLLICKDMEEINRLKLLLNSQFLT